MVKHAVKDHADALRVALTDKIGQIRVVTETAVEFFIVRRFVAVTDRFKEWSDVDCVAA